jgi:tRNA 5-methylaminomethyl-2-thiouridine biosynthesis bifunctional protein
MPIYDTAIIGAGINGCSCAYFLSQAQQNVILIDQDGIAAGGSGAAGAVFSPLITKRRSRQRRAVKSTPF